MISEEKGILQRPTVTATIFSGCYGLFHFRAFSIVYIELHAENDYYYQVLHIITPSGAVVRAQSILHATFVMFPGTHTPEKASIYPDFDLDDDDKPILTEIATAAYLGHTSQRRRYRARISLHQLYQI